MGGRFASQDHAIGADLCLVGHAGSGKSFMAQVFADRLGYDAEVVQLYVPPWDVSTPASSDALPSTHLYLQSQPACCNLTVRYKGWGGKVDITLPAIFGCCRYRDMTSRDLCLSRTTDGRGNTGWTLSPVVTAAMRGELERLQRSG